MTWRAWVLIAAVARHLNAAYAAGGEWRLQFPPWGEPGTPAEGAPVVWAPIIGPFTGHGCYPSRYMAMRIAVSHVNRRDATLCPAIASLRSNFELRYDILDDNANNIGAASAVLKLIGNETNRRRVKAVVGPNNSGAAAASSQILSVFGIPQISNGASSSDLSNKATYPNFFRVISPDSLQMRVLAGFIAYCGFLQVNLVYFDAIFQSGQASDFKQSAETVFALRVNAFKVPNSGDGGVRVSAANAVELRQVLRAVRLTGCRVVVGVSINEEAWDLWRIADEQGMVRAPGWLWLGSNGINGVQLGGNVSRVAIFHGTIFINGNELGPRFPTFTSLWARDMQNTDVPEFTSMPICKGDVVCTGHPEFTGWKAGVQDKSLVCRSLTTPAYDAIVTLAIVADRLLGAGNGTRNPANLSAADWFAEMKKLSNPGRTFNCLSGEVTFNQNQERALPMSFFNWQAGSLTPVEVAGWNSRSNYTWIPGARLVYPTGDDMLIVNSTVAPPLPSGRPPDCRPGEVYDNAVGACDACPPGFQAVANLGGTVSTCVPCSPGSYQPQAGQTECLLCPAGAASADPAAVSCTPCRPGTAQAVQGSKGCQLCATGTSQAGVGQDSCTRCAVGSFAALQGSTACSLCQAGETTRFEGAMAAFDCACPAGSYMSASDRSACLECKAGMVCPFGADEAGFSTGVLDGIGAAPALQPGFYSAPSSPLSVFRCLSPKLCPGGVPGNCVEGSFGTACSRCEPGFTPSSSGCQECSRASTVLTALVPIVLLLGMPPVIYYLANSPVSSSASNSLGTSLSLGILITVAQVLAMFKDLTVPWSSSAGSTLKGFQFLLFDTDAFGSQCVIGDDPSMQYLARVLAPYVALVAILLYYLGFLVCRRHRWDSAKALNSAGQLLQTVFIALVVTAVMPFQCSLHPNGSRSVIKYPDIICGEPAQAPLVAMALTLLLTLVLPFVVFNIYGTITTGGRTPRELMRLRYLLYRFRPDVWWWGSIFTLRQLLLAFAPIVQPDDMNVQVMFLSGVFSIYLALLCFFWPWKTHELNIVDAASVYLLQQLCVSSSSNAFSLVILAMLFALNSAMLLAGAASVCYRGPQGAYGLQYPRYKSLSQLNGEWQSMCEQMGNAAPEECLRMLNEMNAYDRWAVDNIIGIVQAHQRGTYCRTTVGASRSSIGGTSATSGSSGHRASQLEALEALGEEDCANAKQSDKAQLEITVHAECPVADHDPLGNSKVASPWDGADEEADDVVDTEYRPYAGARWTQGGFVYRLDALKRAQMKVEPPLHQLRTPASGPRPSGEFCGSVPSMP